MQSLQTIAFKSVKRENVDKKLFTLFKKYAKSHYSKNKVFLTSKSNILYEFIIGNLTPPCKYNEIQYKSINASFLLFFFNSEEVCEVYKDFIKYELDFVLNLLKTNFNMKDFLEIHELRKYLENLYMYYQS